MRVVVAVTGKEVLRGIEDPTAVFLKVHVSDRTQTTVRASGNDATDCATSTAFAYMHK
jgi:hypothetical protein